MDSKLDLWSLHDSWEEDRKFILRGWSLVFSILSTLLVLSVLDGRMAYLQGPYTGYVGFWTDCSRQQCAILGQVPVLIHMSMGFMMLALALCLILLPSMGLSFLPVFQRLNKIDLVFSSLSFCIGLLIVLSMTLFVVNCQTLEPRPHVSYLLSIYLCWGGGALMLWAGALSYLNHVGMWGLQSISWERRVSNRRMTYCRWAQQSSRRCTIRLQALADHKPVHSQTLSVHCLSQRLPPNFSESPVLSTLTGHCDQVAGHAPETRPPCRTSRPSEDGTQSPVPQAPAHPVQLCSDPPSPHSALTPEVGAQAVWPVDEALPRSQRGSDPGAQPLQTTPQSLTSSS